MSLNFYYTMIAVFIITSVVCSMARGESEPDAAVGYPAGFLPDCPGMMKNATIKGSMMQQLQVVAHRMTSSGEVVRKAMPILLAPKMILKDKFIDLKKRKTLVYAVGFLDSSMWPQTQAIGTAYSKRGYNVFISETFTFLNSIYPKSARLTRSIGKKLGEFLVKLSIQGLDPENLELVGLSLGAHIVSFASKHYYSVTGKKPSRLTALDPAGPCFRNLSPKYRLDSSDAERVDVIHTNIDGFGIAQPLGHIDIYVNGGEFQPGDIAYIPCLVLCSHVKAAIYWWQAIEHPKKFIAVQCDSVQDARYAKCFNNTMINYMGRETDFSKPGIYYLATYNQFPYYRGKEGLKAENEIYTSVVRSINSDDDR